MKRLMHILLILTILLVFPQVTYAAPVTQNDAGENTLTEALGTLAVYAAIIAALAAGTEVITDLLRPFFGLERQPQAMETFEQMKEWLPATLKEMDVDLQAQAQLQGYLNQLDSTVKEVEKLADKDQIAQEIQKWVLGTIKSVGVVSNEQLDAELQKFKEKLKETYSIEGNPLDSAINSAREIFKELQGDPQKVQNVIKLASSLDSFGNLLDAVEGHRSQEMSYFRRGWRALRDWRGLGLMRLIFPGEERYQKLIESDGWKEKLGEILRKVLPDDDRWANIRERSLLGVLLYYPEQAWNRLKAFLSGSSETTEGIKGLLTPENAAQAILALDRNHQLTEARRKRLLRFTAAFIGMSLAVVVRIDSLELLKPLFDPKNLPKALFDDGLSLTLETILENLLRVSLDVKNWRGLGKWLFAWIERATPGMLLSGLAASAGSSFWHDQLDRLRATKKAAEQVTTVVGQLQGSQGQGE